MSRGEYKFQTDRFNVCVSRRSPRNDEPSTTDLDAAIEKCIRDEEARAPSFRRQCTKRAFDMLLHPVPDEAMENPPDVILIGSNIAILVNGNGYTMRTKGPLIWEVKPPSLVHMSGYEITDRGKSVEIPWLRDLIREFGGQMVFRTFENAWEFEFLNSQKIMDVFAQYHLDPPAVRFSMNKYQNEPFAVVVDVDRAQAVVFSDRIGAIRNGHEMTPWTKKLFERDDIHAILLEIIKCI